MLIVKDALFYFIKKKKLVRLFLRLVFKKINQNCLETSLTLEKYVIYPFLTVTATMFSCWIFMGLSKFFLFIVPEKMTESHGDT
jgi:hypothetical protein